MSRPIYGYCDGGILRPKDTQANLFGIAYAFRLVRYGEAQIDCAEFKDTEHEQILFQRSCFWPRDGSNNVAEIYAAVAMLRYIIQCTVYSDVVVCTDSSTCIYWLTNPNPTSRGGAFKYPHVMEWLHFIDDAVSHGRLRISTILHKGHPSKPDLKRGWGVRNEGGKPLPVSKHQDWCDQSLSEIKRTYISMVRCARLYGGKEAVRKVTRERIVRDDARLEM